MTAPTRRRRGRPPTGSTDLDQHFITSTAIQLLQTNGWNKFSMRALAEQLQVDPMALYHYFSNKTALLEAMVTTVFTALDPLHPPFDAAQPLEQRVEHLAQAYLQIVLRFPELVGELIAGRLNVHEPVRRFDDLFQQAMGDLPLDASSRRHATNLLVDYLHGYALGATSATSPEWRHGTAIIIRGIRAIASEMR
ncbi:TetR/AcrR family transcriptional regulator [Deinococcus peraridilitoris]|nr:TetR/AcrR family transcriptional regulator [Deinococcus peraridilitoris]